MTTDPNTPPVSRRDWLKRMGLVAAASSLPGALTRRRAARADDPEVPLRFVVFYDHTGFVDRFARLRAPGQRDWDAGGRRPTASDWALPPAFRDLAPYQDRMVPIVGLDMRSARLSQPGAPGGGHGHLATNALTAAPRVFYDRPGGGSIDQIVADGLFASGVVTPHHSLLLKLGAGRGQARPNYRPDGTNLRPLWRPDAVYDTVFPPELSGEAAAREALRDRWQAIERLSDRIGSARESRLTGEQRERYRAHRELRRAHQARLMRTLDIDAPIPDRTTLLGPWAETLPGWRRPEGLSDEDVWRDTERIHLTCLTQALQLDLTRVAVVSNGWLPYELWRSGGETYEPSRFLGQDNHAFHHTLTNADHGLGEDGERYMESYHRGVLGPLRTLLDMLDGAVDSSGGSVLDNTIVLLASEMSSPAHTGVSIKWSLVVGDGAAARVGITPGRALLLPRANADDEVLPFEAWSELSAAQRRYHTRGIPTRSSFRRSPGPWESRARRPTSAQRSCDRARCPSRTPWGPSCRPTLPRTERDPFRSREERTVVDSAGVSRRSPGPGSRRSSAAACRRR